ncbi:phosphate signaling complex protein PhoU [Aquihabitans sp. McL0605]|uniref:phosphate signaling complex protein PhoU n=1 Tax=Aquihabitans sp. McL0605 TaxID=3415671 RepID=UPI003CEFD178
MVRQGFNAELDQIRLQVELMAVRVDQNLERMKAFLATGDLDVAATTIAGDDDIDAMNLSLTERCYDLLAREAPVASDLRFVMSVLRVLGELERVGDLALRVVKVGEDWELVQSYRGTYEILLSMADTAVDQFREFLRAWSSQDLDLADHLARSGPVLDLANAQLVKELLLLEGPTAVAAALNSLVIGKALDRIADHSAIIGSRLRYLLTGDAEHLAAEIR